MKNTLRCILILFITTPFAVNAEWEKLENVKFSSNAANDGDSFHATHNSREYLFRLYFVDSPETEDRIKDRVAEQANAFGLSAKHVLRYGKEAAKFTKERLNKPFTVWTEWADAKGDSKMPRYFAFVQDAEGKDLGQELVGNGLARVYGAQADHPEGPDRSGQWSLLDARVKEAKTKQRGCWNKNQK